MAVIETWYEQDLQKPVEVRYPKGNLFSNNGNGNRIGVVVTNNGEAVTLSGTVSGYAVLSDGTTVPCTGSRSGNKASILVPPAAYLPGAIFVTVFLTDGSTVTTLAAVSSTVLQARTDSQVDPGSVVTDWTNTINAAMQSVQTAAANLGNIVATPYASLTYPVPLGKYTVYNNNLYRCISPIASSESFTAAHWSSAINLGDEVSDLKSAIGENIGVGIYPHSAIPVSIDGDDNLTTSVSGNVVTFTSTGSGFRWGKIKESKIGIIRNTGFSYLILSECFTNGNRYGLGLCLDATGSNYGKLFAFKYGTLDFNAGITVLSSTGKNAYNRYDLEYIDKGVYDFYVNGSKTTIDLSETSILVGTVPVTFSIATVGILVAPNASTSINVIKDINDSIPNEITLIQRGASGTISANKIHFEAIEESSSVEFYWCGINKKEFSLYNIDSDYIVLSEITVEGNLYCISLCVAVGPHFGKLVAFKNGTVSFGILDTNVLSGISWFAENLYHFEYVGNGVYNVYVQNQKKTIDLKNYNISIDVPIRFSSPLIGSIVATTTAGNNFLLDKGWKYSEWFAFGDSITHMGYYVPSACDITGLKCTRYGHSGYSYWQLKDVYTELLSGDEPQIITLFAGTNDFGQSETVEHTSEGLTAIIEGIYSAFPKVQIIIVTPLQRNFDISLNPDDQAGLGPNNIGKYLIDYVTTIKEIAEKYSIPCLDLYSCGGINELNASQKTSDGLHPTIEYGNNIGVIIGNFINNYAPF